MTHPNLRIILTGHRPNKIGGYDRNNPLRVHLRERMRTVFACLIAEHWPCQPTLITGGALGIDQDGAGVAYRMCLPYDVYVPFDGQASRWPSESRIAYAALLSHARKVVLCYQGRPTSDGHAASLLLDRNRRMNADHPEAIRVVTAVWDGSDGGTAHCVRCAERDFGLRVVRIRPQEARETMHEWRQHQQLAARAGVVCV